MRTAFALIVTPFSRSSSMLSSICAVESRRAIVPVRSSRPSATVVYGGDDREVADAALIQDSYKLSAISYQRPARDSPGCPSFQAGVGEQPPPEGGGMGTWATRLLELPARGAGR